MTEAPPQTFLRAFEAFIKEHHDFVESNGAGDRGSRLLTRPKNTTYEFKQSRHIVLRELRKFCSANAMEEHFSNALFADCEAWILAGCPTYGSLQREGKLPPGRPERH